MNAQLAETLQALVVVAAQPESPERVAKLAALGARAAEQYADEQFDTEWQNAVAERAARAFSEDTSDAWRTTTDVLVSL